MGCKRKMNTLCKNLNMHALHAARHTAHICRKERQIHTPGPSRVVQRPVSALREIGFFHKESAI